MALVQGVGIGEGVTWKKIGNDDNENEVIVQELVGQIIEQLKATFKDNLISYGDLKQHLKAHFDLALKQFLAFRDSDDSRQWDKFKGQLIAELKIAFRDFCLDFTNQFDANLSKVAMSFRSQVESQVQSKCLPIEKLQDILSGVKASILQQFEGSTIPELEQLTHRLEEEALWFISENNKRLGEHYLQFNGILQELLEQYESMVGLMLPDDELETTSDKKFESTFQKCKHEVLKKLNESMTFDVPEMREMFETRMVGILTEQFSEKMKAANSLKAQKLAEAGTVVNNAIADFVSLMFEKIKHNDDDTEIQRFREAQGKVLFASITEKIFDIIDDRKTVKELQETAKQKMENVFQEMKAQRQVQVKAFQEHWDRELNSMCADFMNELEQLCQSTILPEIEELQTKRETIINELIRKANTSWLDDGNKMNLHKSFGDVAKEQMKSLSQSVLENHAKILNDNFNQQKRVMNECLEVHEMKIKELLKGELNADVIVTAKTIEVNTLEQFEIQVKTILPISLAATAQLKIDLKQEISRIHNRLEKQIYDRSLLVKSEVSQLITDTVNDYKHLMNAFSIASNYGKDKLVQIHEDLKTRAYLSLQKYLKLAKYSGDVKEEQQNLKTMIDLSFNTIIEGVGNKRSEWNQKLELCKHEAINYYKQLFNRSIGLVSNEEELKKCHEDSKEKAIALWEDSFPHHYFGDIFLPEQRNFARYLDNEFETEMRQKWKDINLDIDRNTRAAVDNLVKKYEEQMNSALSKFDYVSNDMITSKHHQFSNEAEKGLNKVKKPNNISKKTYDDLLANRLRNTLDCLKSQNMQKKDNVQSNISSQLNYLKDAIVREVFDLKALPGISELFQTYWLRAEIFLNRFKIPDNCKGELKLFAEENLNGIIKEIQVEWDNTQPDSNELQLLINTAVEEYNREMENRTTKTGQVFLNRAMEKHHAYSLQIVKKKFEQNVKQTTVTRDKFNNAIEAVLKKFEELNDLRAAEHSEAAVGIDLGTTFSCVAIYKGGKIEMIPDREHHSNTVPSYVFYESDTKTVVGHSAKDQSVIHPQNTIFDSKRLIGRKFKDPQTQKDITQWPFKVVKDPIRTEPKIEVHGKTIHPEEVSGEILKHLKNNAELHLGREVKDVVITVPAYFNDAQKRATKGAAAFANINVLEIINEPTSAAIAYSLNYTDGKSKNILVFDLGGGTFDVSVLSTEECNIVVKAVGGDNHLGGEDFDSNMVDFCIEKFREETGFTIPKNVSHSTAALAVANNVGEGEFNKNEDKRKIFETLRRLRQKCEQAKINLSKTDKVRVVIDYIFEKMHLDVEITVDDFNEMNKQLFEKCIEIVRDTVKDSGLDNSQFDDVVLVGGSSRIPEVQRLLTEFFDGKSLIMTLNPDEVVAQGAAYRAAMLSGSRTRELDKIKFQDVNPLSLGIEVIGKNFSIIIPKNTPIPCKRTEPYVTTKDYQTKLNVAIYEGEDEKVENNNLLGEFLLSNIPSKKKGQEPVDVTIKCDEEGLIHVTAKVRSNSSSGDIQIHSNRGGLTEEDIKNAMKKK